MPVPHLQEDDSGAIISRLMLTIRNCPWSVELLVKRYCPQFRLFNWIDSRNDLGDVIVCLLYHTPQFVVFSMENGTAIVAPEQRLVAPLESPT